MVKRPSGCLRRCRWLRFMLASRCTLKTSCPPAVPGPRVLPNTSTRLGSTWPSLIPGHGPSRSPWSRSCGARPRYDVVLVDCPPNLYLATWAALAASDALMIPVQPEDYGIQGLSAVERSINLVRATVNPRLAMLGVVVSMFGARKVIHQTYDDLLRSTYGEAVFARGISHAVDLPEATMNHTPLPWFKPRSAPAERSCAGRGGAQRLSSGLHGAERGGLMSKSDEVKSAASLGARPGMFPPGITRTGCRPSGSSGRGSGGSLVGMGCGGTNRAGP